MTKIMKKYYHNLLVGGVVGMAVALSLSPLSRFPLFSTSVLAQTQTQEITEEQLRKYAKAVIAIENLRRATYASIENIVGSNASLSVSCDQKKSFSQLPPAARTMAEDYCNQSEIIVKNNGLTVSQFNQITQQIKQNPSLKQRLQKIIEQMQPPGM